MDNNENKNLDKTNINWYPGHMAKTKREIKEVLNLIDVIITVVDARIPYSSFSLGLNEITKNKENIIVLSKVDLCDKNETGKWMKHYAELGYKVIEADLKNSNDYKKIISKVDEIMIPVNEKRKAKGMLNAKAKVLVVGVPNVGKSTLINKMCGKTKVQVGNKPGVTKSLSWIKVGSTIDLLDSPGLLEPKIEEEKVGLNLAAMTSIKETIIPIDTVAVHILEMLDKYYPEILNKNYGVESLTGDFVEDYHLIADYRGIKTRDEDVMFERVSMMILNDIKSEKIKGITFDRFGE